MSVEAEHGSIMFRDGLHVFTAVLMRLARFVSAHEEHTAQTLRPPWTESKALTQVSS